MQAAASQQLRHLLRIPSLSGSQQLRPRVRRHRPRLRLQIKQLGQLRRHATQKRVKRKESACCHGGWVALLGVRLSGGSAERRRRRRRRWMGQLRWTGSGAPSKTACDAACRLAGATDAEVHAGCSQKARRPRCWSKRRPDSNGGAIERDERAGEAAAVYLPRAVRCAAAHSGHRHGSRTTGQHRLAATFEKVT